MIIMDIRRNRLTVNMLPHLEIKCLVSYCFKAKDTHKQQLADRIKSIWVNGNKYLYLKGQLGYPPQNYDLCNCNKNVAHYIGANNGSEYFDGQMAHVNFVDGQSFDTINISVKQMQQLESGNLKLAPSVTYGNNGYF